MHAIHILGVLGPCCQELVMIFFLVSMLLYCICSFLRQMVDVCQVNRHFQTPINSTRFRRPIRSKTMSDTSVPTYRIYHILDVINKRGYRLFRFLLFKRTQQKFVLRCETDAVPSQECTEFDHCTSPLCTC